MKQALCAWKDINAYPEMVTLKTMIMCDKLTTIVYTCMMLKHYSIVYNKHVVNDNHPFSLLKDIHPHPSPSLAHGPLSMDVQRTKPIIPFQAGLPMMIIGPMNCGKTYWINRLLTNDIFTQPVASILYCYSVYQEFSNTTREDPSIACPIHFQEGLPT